MLNFKFKAGWSLLGPPYQVTNTKVRKIFDMAKFILLKKYKGIMLIILTFVCIRNFKVLRIFVVWK